MAGKRDRLARGRSEEGPYSILCMERAVLIDIAALA